MLLLIPPVIYLGYWALLWMTRTGDSTTNPAKIVFGQLPAGFKQAFPEGDTRPADTRGKTVHVWIDNRFQVMLGPGHEGTQGD